MYSFILLTSVPAVVYILAVGHVTLMSYASTVYNQNNAAVGCPSFNFYLVSCFISDIHINKILINVRY